MNGPGTRRDGRSRGSRRQDASVHWIRVLSLATVVAAYGLVVLGSTVRVTNSGMGCPGWPLCAGQVGPIAQLHPLIEQSHRYLASLVTILILALAALAWRTGPKARHVRGRAIGVWVMASVLRKSGIRGTRRAPTRPSFDGPDRRDARCRLPHYTPPQGKCPPRAAPTGFERPGAACSAGHCRRIRRVARCASGSCGCASRLGLGTVGCRCRGCLSVGEGHQGPHCSRRFPRRRENGLVDRRSRGLLTRECPFLSRGGPAGHHHGAGTGRRHDGGWCCPGRVLGFRPPPTRLSRHQSRLEPRTPASGKPVEAGVTAQGRRNGTTSCTRRRTTSASPAATDRTLQSR